MEKEFSIAELSQIWGVSVPTTWNRIRKEGLTTFIKKNKNNKEITYVTISDDILNDYVINDNNNVNNVVNNVYYEETLSNNNVNKVENQDIIDKQPDTLKDIINTITTIHNDYNERLKEVNNELINYKSKTLLLEDKAGREGYYLNEINDLKKVNKRDKLIINLLIIFITILLLFITGFITYNYASNKTPEAASTEQVKVDAATAQAPKPEPKPQPKPVKARRK